MSFVWHGPVKITGAERMSKNNRRKANMPPCVTARMPWKFTAILVGALNAATALAGPIAKFDIPAQALGTALQTLSTQAGITLSFRPETLGSARSMAISGEMSVDDALRQLLAGSGRAFRQEGTNNYVLLEPARGENEGMLSEVVVTATRTERRLDEVPASVTVITADDLAQQHRALPEDALRNTEGIDFNAPSTSGFANAPNIRGIGGSFAGATSSVLVDGLATDSPISGVAGRGGFGFLAAQDIERIEVVRGPASALHGPNVIGGVVNIIPKRWHGKTGAEINAGIGSHDAHASGLVVGTSGEAFDIRLSTYHSRTDGFVGTPDLTPWGEKDVAPLGWNDRKLNLNGTTRLGEDQEIGLAIQQYRTKHAYSGGLPFTYNGSEEFLSSEKRTGEAYTLSYQKVLSGGHRIKASFRRLNLEQSWFDGQYGMGVGGRKSESDIFDIQGDALISEQNTVTLGISRQSADYQSSGKPPYDSFLDESAATITGIFIQDEHRFGKWTSFLGGRFDRFDQDASHSDGVQQHQGNTESVFNPRIGLRYRFAPGSSLYASAGTAYLPANADFMFRNSARWKDNPDLKPESSKTYEIGLNHGLPLGALRAAVYRTDYRNMISIQTASRPWQYVNIGKVVVEGVEFGFDGDLGEGWRPYANYAYTHSIIEKSTDPMSVGKRVQRIVPEKFNLGLQYAPGGMWSTSFAGRYVGERYFTDRNTPDRRAGGYFVGDLTISASLPSGATGRWSAYLAINNLFDKKYSEYEYTYADRRNYWIGLSGRF